MLLAENSRDLPFKSDDYIHLQGLDTTGTQGLSLSMTSHIQHFLAYCKLYATEGPG